MLNKKYLSIVEYYNSCLEKHGDSHLGVDWPKREDAETRYKIMLEIIKNNSKEVSLLDFGCGASHMYEYMLKNKISNIKYSGLDLSDKFISLSRSKFPENNYYCIDILDKEKDIPVFDYIIMNGIFTEKRELSFKEMFEFFQAVLKRIFIFTKKGMAFNVMSKQVDWERNDLFHLSFDLLASFLTKEISRNFMIRHDYKLYEYTVYVFK